MTALIEKYATLDYNAEEAQTYRYDPAPSWRVQKDECIRCGGRMVNVGFQIYRCTNCGHEEKPEDVI